MQAEYENRKAQLDVTSNILSVLSIYDLRVTDGKLHLDPEIEEVWSKDKQIALSYFLETAAEGLIPQAVFLAESYIALNEVGEAILALFSDEAVTEPLTSNPVITDYTNLQLLHAIACEPIENFDVNIPSGSGVGSPFGYLQEIITEARTRAELTPKLNYLGTVVGMINSQEDLFDQMKDQCLAAAADKPQPGAV